MKPGQRIAIVGPTGCGKSTVINLLMRFYDVDEGSISVDNIDIREMTRRSLRENYGMVLQETWLKNGTIRENIIYGKPDATEEEMLQASKKPMPIALLNVCRKVMIQSYRKMGEFVSGAEAAAMYCPGYALPAADAYFRRSDIID